MLKRPWTSGNLSQTGMGQEGMMPTLAMSGLEARGLRGTWKYKRQMFLAGFW